MIDKHRAEPVYGWVMVGVASVFIAIGTGSMTSISVFLKPLMSEFGWLRGDTALAYMAGTIFTGLGGIGMGYLADRFSTRMVVMIGAISIGLAYLLLAYQTALWQFYLFYCLLGGLGFAAFLAPLIANVGAWFHQHKGMALGITTAGAALGNGLVPYFARYLISVSGWREAYTTMGIGCMVVLLPMAFLVRAPPGMGQAAQESNPGKATAQQYTHNFGPVRIVALLSMAVVFSNFAVGTPLVHVVAMAQDLGIDAQSAASVLLLIFVFGFLGRIFFGKFADTVGGVRAWLFSAVGITVLVFFFTQMRSVAGFYLIASLFGLAYSGVNTCLFIAVREMIPIKMQGTSVGVVTLFAWMGYGVGGYQGGVFFDLTGDYTLSYVNAALAGLLALIVLVLLLTVISKHRLIALENRPRE